MKDTTNQIRDAGDILGTRPSPAARPQRTAITCPPLLLLQLAHEFSANAQIDNTQAVTLVEISCLRREHSRTDLAQRLDAVFRGGRKCPLPASPAGGPRHGRTSYKLSSGFAKLVHGCQRLALTQTDEVLCFHVDLSVPRITRHFFPDPTREVELLIRVLQLNLCKHYTI